MKTTIRLFLTFLCVSIIGSKVQAVSPAPDGAYPGWNTAEGSGVLFNVTSGTFNTAVGGHALYEDTTGQANTAVGAFALTADTSGNQNVAVGQGALRSNTTGTGNTAVGFQAAKFMGGPMNDNNTAIGFAALDMLTHGNSNTAIGANALDAITGGGQNIAVGSFAGGFLNSGNNNIYIGSSGDTYDNDTIRIGDPTIHSATYVAGIYGQTASSGIQVYINSDGQLGTLTSSCRFKKDIQSMDSASEAILALKPVTFHYRSDRTNTPQFGLIAEEVAAVDPDLVVRDKDGKPYTVRYEAVDAMLLNEFLKDHKTVEEQQATIGQLKSNATKQDATISELKKTVGVLMAQLKDQAAQIQTVSAQLEVSKPAPQTVLNNQ